MTQRRIPEGVETDIEALFGAFFPQSEYRGVADALPRVLARAKRLHGDLRDAVTVNRGLEAELAKAHSLRRRRNV